jgi:hypothetical protein
MMNAVQLCGVARSIGPKGNADSSAALRNDNQAPRAEGKQGWQDEKR